MLSDAGKTAIGLAILMTSVAAVMLLVPLESPSDQLPYHNALVADGELENTTGDVDFQQTVEVQFYFGEERSSFTNDFNYDADTGRAYIRHAGGVAQAPDYAQPVVRQKYYAEPVPSNNSRTRVYILRNDSDVGEEQREQLEKAYDDVAFSSDTYVFYNVYNSSTVPTLRERSYGNVRGLSTAYTNGRVERSSWYAPNGKPDVSLVTPNYTEAGTTTLDGEQYELYEAQSHWVDGRVTEGNTQPASVFNASGRVLYDAQDKYYRHVNISYDYVVGNTRFAVLKHKITKLNRIGVAIEQNRVAEQGAVDSVRCPDWTKRAGPTPRCMNESGQV